MSVGRITSVTTAQCDFYWNEYKRYRISWTKKLAAEYQRDCQKFFDRELRQSPTLVELARRIVNQCVTCNSFERIKSTKMSGEATANFHRIRLFLVLRSDISQS